MEYSMVSSGRELLSARSRKHDLASYGQKSAMPSGSWLEGKQLDSRRETHHDLLAEPRFARRDQLSMGVWLDKSNLVLITKLSGSFWEYMGVEADLGHCLYPEEAIYLIEAGEMEVSYGEIPLSLQAAMKVMLPSSSLMDQYLVYAHLSRTGCKVIKHQAHLRFTRYEKQIRIDQYQTKRKRGKIKLSDSNKADDITEVSQNKGIDQELDDFYAMLGTSDPAKNECETKEKQEVQEMSISKKRKIEEVLIDIDTEFDSNRSKLLDFFPQMIGQSIIKFVVPSADLLPIVPVKSEYEINLSAVNYYSRYLDETQDDGWNKWGNNESGRGRNNWGRGSRGRGNSWGRNDWRKDSKDWNSHNYNDRRGDRQGYKSHNQGERGDQNRSRGEGNWQSNNRKDRRLDSAEYNRREGHRDRHGRNENEQYRDEHDRRMDHWKNNTQQCSQYNNEHDRRWEDGQEDTFRGNNHWDRHKKNEREQHKDEHDRRWNDNRQDGFRVNTQNEGFQLSQRFGSMHCDNEYNNVKRNFSSVNEELNYPNKEVMVSEENNSDHKINPEWKKVDHNRLWENTREDGFSEVKNEDKFSNNDINLAWKKIDHDRLWDDDKEDKFSKMKEEEESVPDYNSIPEWKKLHRDRKRQNQKESYPKTLMRVDPNKIRSWKDYNRLLIQSGEETLLKSGPCGALWRKGTKPLVKPSMATNHSSLLSLISLHKSEDVESKPKINVSVPLVLSYDVYLPSSQYKKTCPTIPDKRVTVMRECEIPSMSQILEVTSRFEDGVSVVCVVVVGGEVRTYTLATVDLPNPQQLLTD